MSGSLFRLRALSASMAAVVCAQFVSADVNVRFDPPMVEVLLGTTFDIDILADITDPVVGWGLDLTLQDPAIASLTGAPTIVAPWLAGFAPDGDGLVGLADPFSPINGSVSGIGIVLATLSFSVDALGGTDLNLSVTLGDLTEGFPLDPTGFDATVTFEIGHINVTPEPASLLLMALAIPILLGSRRR